MKIKSAVMFSALAIIPFGLFAAQEGMVTVQRLNIRVNPGNSAVVGAYKKGDKIMVQEVKNGWCRIMLPKDSAVWVANKFIKDGKIVKSVNLRSGPGLNYGAYGIVEAGQQVTVVDDKTNKEWIKIEPLPSISGWVAAQFVKLEKGAGATTATEGETSPDKAPVAVSSDAQKILDQIDNASEGGAKDGKATKDTGKKATAKTEPVKAPAKPVETEKAPAKPAEPVKPVDGGKAPAVAPVPQTLPEENTEELEKKLPFVDEPAEDVTIEGVVSALNTGAVVVTHALGVHEKGGQFKTLCFLYGHADELNKYVGYKVVISGKKRSVKTWNYPVVKVTGIAVYND